MAYMFKDTFLIFQMVNLVIPIFSVDTKGPRKAGQTLAFHFVLPENANHRTMTMRVLKWNDRAEVQISNFCPLIEVIHMRNHI